MNPAAPVTKILMGGGQASLRPMSVGGKRVLVTGAGGFIGSHLVELLVREGADVRCLVHYNARGDRGNLELADQELIASVDVVLGDITDPFGVERAAADRDVVFHLAALIGIPYSYLAPKAYVDVNVAGTLNVLEAARRHDIERVVHTSTSETYGTARYSPIDEDHPLQGQSPYSASKIGADKIAESYFRSFETPVVTLRPFNTFGPRQSLRAVIPTIIAQALSGDVVRLGSLDPVRDFTYVTDTARAFAAVAVADGVAGQVLNAGNGQSITVGDLAHTILELLGSDATIETDDARVRPPASEVFELIAETRRIREATGWEPEVSLRDGLGRTINFVRERLTELRPDIYAV
jgi:NAD dependent epimerase/dehydratase